MNNQVDVPCIEVISYNGNDVTDRDLFSINTYDLNDLEFFFDPLENNSNRYVINMAAPDETTDTSLEFSIGKDCTIGDVKDVAAKILHWFKEEKKTLEWVV